MVGEQWWPVVRSGTPRVQGYPTPHSDTGGGGVRLSRLAMGHRHQAARKRPLLPGTAAAPSPPRRDGVRLRGDAPASRDLHTPARAPRWPAAAHSAGVEGAPSGGGRATTRRGLDATAPGPLGWAGANTKPCAQRLTRTPVVTAPAVTTHTNGCLSVWRLATACRAMGHARRGQVGARHNGGRVQRGPKQSFSGSLWPRYMRQPVMLSWPSANLPRRPARLGRARCPDWPAIRCPARHAPGFDCSGAGGSDEAAKEQSLSFS